MEPQQPGQGVPHLETGHHCVHKAVLLLEFRPLEALRQCLADGLLDHPGAGEADQGAGLRLINIPKVKPFGITFQQTTNIPLGKEGITLSYTITGADADTQVRAFVSKGDLEVTLSEKNIFVKPKSNASVNGSEVIVLLFNKEKTITTLLTFIDAPKDVNTDGSTEDYKVEEGTWDE